MATAALLAGTVLAAGGQNYSGASANAEGKSAQSVANYNASVEEQKAKNIEAKAEYDSKRHAESAAREMSSLTAGLGSSGAVMSEGSPLLIASKQSSELELENLMIGYNANTEATAARNQATLDRTQGKLYRQQGRNKATASYIGAGGSLLTGFGTAKRGY